MSGTIATDTIWTAANSPYIVTSSVTVQGTDGADGITTLTIEPGVEVRFNPYTQLAIGASSGNPGALVAQGTAGSPILFTSNKVTPAAGDWYGIRFQNTSDDATSILEYCTIDYAGYSSGAIYSYYASPRIISSTFANSKTYGIYISGGAPTVSGNTFSGSGNYDIYYTSPAGGVITGNNMDNGVYLNATGISELSGNTFNCNPAYPFYLVADDVVELMANTFNNPGNGSYLKVNGGTISRDATWQAIMPYHILGNITVQGTDGADGITTLTIEPGVELRFNLYTQLYVGNSSGAPGKLVAQGTIERPILFTSNQTTQAPGNWYGIRFRATSPNSSILENTIVEYANYNIYAYNSSPTILNTKSRFASTAGVYLYGAPASAATLGCMDVSNNAYGFQVYYAYPTISGHNIMGNSTAGLAFTGTSLDDATGNWWGDAGGPGVNGANIVTGTVTFSPWLTAAKNCDQIVNEAPEVPLPHTPTPADSAVRVPVVSGNVDLSWQSTDPNTGDTVLFDIYLGTAPDALSLLASGQTTNTRTASLAADMTYYWQVVAKDYEFTSTGPIWNFTTDGPPPDLIVSSFASQPLGNVNVGDAITFTATITNQGVGAVVDGSTMEIAMDGIALNSASIGTILLNDQSLQINGTWAYAAGEHTLSATVDPLNTIVETDETNNTLVMIVADIVDQEPPYLTSTWPENGGFVSLVDQVLFTLADRHNAVDPQPTLNGFLLEGSGGAISGTMSNSGDSFTFTPAAALADDSYTATIAVADNLSNTGQQGFIFVVDSVPPAKPVITGGTVASGVIQERPILNIAHTFTVTVTGTREADTSLWIDGALAAPVGSAAWSADINLEVGDNVVEVWSVDRAGNESPRAWVDIRLESEDAVELEYSESGRLIRVVPVRR